jgi:hypothetical protein
VVDTSSEDDPVAAVPPRLIPEWKPTFTAAMTGLTRAVLVTLTRRLR